MIGNSARHVRSQKSGFLTIISVLSICGVAMSSCALSSVVSVMGGFSADLKRKILGNNAHIVIDTVEGVPWADYDRTVDAVRKVPRVIGATPVVHGEVMASSASNLAGVIVEGIDPKSINQVIELTHNIEVGKFEYLEHPEKLTRLPPSEVIGLGPGGEQYLKGGDAPSLQDDLDPDVRAVIVQKPDRPGLILGRELAKTLHVYVGDEITLDWTELEDGRWFPRSEVLQMLEEWDVNGLTVTELRHETGWHRFASVGVGVGVTQPCSLRQEPRAGGRAKIGPLSGSCRA